MKTNIGYVTSFVFGLLAVGYYSIAKYSEQHIIYFFDLAFRNSHLCVSIIDAIDPKNQTQVYTNKHHFENNEMIDSNVDYCFDIVLETMEGKNAVYSLLESRMIDAYINSDINIIWSENDVIYERQIMSLQQMAYDGWKGGLSAFSLVHYLSHIYTHWIAQFIQNYKISYDWIDQHYTDGDLIISSFTDDNYTLYSHGIGFKHSNFWIEKKRKGIETGLDSNDNNFNIANVIDNSRLQHNSITLEQASENKLQFILETCELVNGSNVLDIGSGWGSFAKFAIPRGVNVHALTISSASFQHLTKLSKEFEAIRMKSSKYAHYGTLNVSLLNFWEFVEIQRKTKEFASFFDAMVCLGTIEHLPYYSKLLDSGMLLLKKGGFLHTDGFATKLGYTTNYFVQKYIYPGDSAPFHASSFFKVWENSKYNLVAAAVDTENYANTLYLWAKKFEKLIKDPKHALYNITEQSKRIYQLYLWGFVMSFQHPTHRVQAWRVVLQKPLVCQEN